MKKINFKKLIKKTILTILILFFLLGTILGIAIIWPTTPPQELLTENYELHKTEIADLKDYFDSKTNDGKTQVSMRFGWLGLISICANGDCFWSSNNDKDYYYKIISELGWDDEVIKTFRKKLKAANCISISSFSKVLDIGFKMDGLVKYSYLVLENDLTEEEIQDWNNFCQYIYYKKNIVFGHGGASFGPQCFRDKKIK